MIAPARFSVSLRSGAAPSGGNSSSREAALHDAGLVRRFNDGDDKAFAEIVTRYRARMFAVALRLLKNDGDAEEIAQDTFLRAHRGLGKFRGDSSLATWLHRIALNLARNRYWYFFRRQRHATLSLDYAVGEQSPGSFSDLVAAEEPGPDRTATVREFSELVSACMERLEPTGREILSLRTQDNHSYQQIARMLGLNIGTVKSRIARARENLRQLMADACPEFASDSSPSAWFAPVRPAGKIQAMLA